MSTLDLRTPGERALQEVRAARVMLRLASGRQQAVEAILGNISAIQDGQPILAASLLVREALRLAPHRRLMLLSVAQQLVREHGLAADVDRQEVQSAADYLEKLIQESKDALELRDKWIRRAMKATLVIATLLILTALGTLIYVTVSGPSAPASDTDGKTRVVGAPEHEAARPQGAESK